MAKGKRSKIKQFHKREFNARIKPAVDARLEELHNSLMPGAVKVEKPKAVAGEYVVQKYPIPDHTRKEAEPRATDMEMDEPASSTPAAPQKLGGSALRKAAKTTTSRVVGKIQKSSQKSAQGKKIKIRLTKVARE
eukprot:TRINITY_DN3864_c0_g1_i1.p1 TRINITY_DN3864_c0_g1~~TRINITY_DN3864_c0_g1_i1.p1  ORF type:complete len:146 (-),score=38.74 TRINITY_DN3864_c0_g1_i1:34-438(-)